LILDRLAVPYGVAFVLQAFSDSGADADHYSGALETHAASVFSRTHVAAMNLSVISVSCTSACGVDSIRFCSAFSNDW